MDVFKQKNWGKKKKQILGDEVPSQGGVIKTGYSDSHPNAAAKSLKFRLETKQTQ